MYLNYPKGKLNEHNFAIKSYNIDNSRNYEHRSILNNELSHRDGSSWNLTAQVYEI